MTVREIITNALRQLGALAGGREPKAADATLGLQTLQAMLLTLPEFSRSLARVRVSANYTAEENQRIFNTSGSPITITLPDAVEDTDDEIPDDSERPPKNGAMVAESSATTAKVYVYVEYLASWMQLTNLTLDSDNPLGPEHDEGLAAMLAVRLQPYFRTPLEPAVAVLATEGRTRIRQRFRQPVDVTTDPLLLSPRDRCY